MRRFILLLLFVAPLTGISQIHEALDKKAIGRMLDWVSIFTLYSDVELSDKVDLRQYTEAASLATAIITNPELSVKIAEVRGATFVNIYPKGILQSNEWLITKLNEVSNAQYDVLNAPYVTLEVAFTPVTNGYTVMLTLRSSNQITHNLADINSIMNRAINGQVFAKPRDAKEKVNKAIFEGLDKLNTLLGQAYAPKIAIRYNDELYLNGQTIETWQRTKETITLTAVNTIGAPLQGVISWTNAMGSSANATVAVDVKGIKQVTVKSGADLITVSVNVKEFEVDLEDVIKEILIKVINDKIAEAREKIDSIKNTSVQLDGQIVETKKVLDARVGMIATSQSSGEIVIEEEIIDERKGTAEELVQLKQDETNNKYIELHRRKFIVIAEILLQIKIEVLLADIIRDDGNMQAYIAAIKDSSPRLITDLILNLTRKPENRAELKNIIVNYLNEQIHEMASRS